MKKILTAIISLLLSGFSAAAYSADEEKKEYNNYVGLEASSISGAGLSYGYRFLPGYMFKICGIYVETSELHTNPSSPDEEDYYTDTFWDAGAELQKTFFTASLGSSLVEGFGLAGGSYWYEETKDPYYPENNDVSKRWIAGFALGMRAIVFERLSLDLALGYQYSRDIEDRERYTGIAGSISAHFLF